MPEAGSVRPAYAVYRFLWTCLDWLYPPVCGGCGATGQRWCNTCLADSQVIGRQICETCGTPHAIGGVCLLCSTQPPAYTALRSWGVFDGPLKKAMHRLKYKKDIALGDALSQPMIPLLRRQRWALDLISPVPLSPARMRERGYNQAAMLAFPVAQATGLRYQPEILKKVKDTSSQVHLSREERKRNVEGAFTANASMARGKKILVIDDVTTTGATIQECAKVLLEAGALEVYGLTLARAIKKGDHEAIGPVDLGA